MQKGVFIPEATFESYILEYFWKGIEGFDKNKGYTFKSVIKHRIYLAEIDASRTFRKKGSDSDKDGYTYEPARWKSLNRPISKEGEQNEIIELISHKSLSAEQEFLNKHNRKVLIKDFAESSNTNKRYANLISFMILGYKGKELAEITGEGKFNNSSMRKLVSRARYRFKIFLKNYDK